MNKQSWLASCCETLANTFIGMAVTFAANHVIFPAYDIRVSAWVSLQIVFWFTVLSIIRGLIVRRMWNAEWWKYIFRK